MCDCITQVEDLFNKAFLTNVGERKIVVHEVKEQGFTTLTILMMKGPIRFFHPYEVKYVAQKKDGTPEKRVSTFKTNLISSYCPICGEKYPDK